MSALASVEITLEADRELTDQEVLDLELAMADCMERFGIEEWNLEVQHDFAECPACDSDCDSCED